LLASFEQDVACSVSVIPLQTRAVLFVYWATTTCRLLGPEVGNTVALSVLPKGTATCYLNGSQAKVSQPYNNYPGALPTEPVRRSQP